LNYRATKSQISILCNLCVSLSLWFKPELYKKQEKMKRITILIITLLIVYSSNAQSLTQDSIQIRNTVMNFYNWYVKNSQRLMTFKLYYSIKKKDEPPYRINWKEAERYLAYIRSSVPGLGEAFIKNQRRFLKEIDSVFKVDTEDEIPYGFDYDWYTNSQEEPEYLVDKLKKSKLWAIMYPSDSTVDVVIYGPGNVEHGDEIIHCISMAKEKNKWKIASIARCNSELAPPPPMEEIKQ